MVKKAKTYQVEFYDARTDKGTEMPNIISVKATSKPVARRKFKKFVRENFPKEKFRISDIIVDHNIEPSKTAIK